ncbi:unnamed protein product [Soboliphyme baturini]|uniref:Uncharacterized protein n=1 Tax=Soboliphyme baturini TaxID=241478 RepID=A0A183IMH8_9BILA|nr:unnamed protein product [Soboliphyme baturini]
MPEDVEEKPKTFRSEGDGDEGKDVARPRCDIVTEEKGDISRMAEDEIPKSTPAAQQPSTSASAARNNVSSAAAAAAASASKRAAHGKNSAFSSSSSVLCSSDLPPRVALFFTKNVAFADAAAAAAAFRKFSFSVPQNGFSSATPLNTALYLPYSYAAAAAANMSPLMMQVLSSFLTTGHSSNGEGRSWKQTSLLNQLFLCVLFFCRFEMLHALVQVRRGLCRRRF